MDKQSQRSEYFCIPIEKTAGGYKVARDWETARLEPIPYNLIQRGHLSKPVAAKAPVDLLGRRHSATILVPENERGQAYVLVDSSGSPIVFDTLNTSDSKVPEDRHVFARYREYLRKELSYSEGLAADQSCYLWSQFVDPLIFHRDVKSGRTGKKPVDWQHVKGLSRVVLVGSAGSGKTSFLRRIAVAIADSDESQRDSLIPVYVQLRNWVMQQGIELLAKREFTRHASSDATRHYDSLRASGRLYYMFDGVDEIASELRQVAMSQLKAFAQSNVACPIIISTRKVARMNAIADEFDWLEIAPFTESQVREFCFRKLDAIDGKCDSFWTRLQAEPDVLSVAKRPLALSLMISKFQSELVSPHFVGEVLLAFVDALVSGWDSVRGIRRSEKLRVSASRRKALLSQLAADMFECDKTSLSTDECRSSIERFVAPEESAGILSMLDEETGLFCRHGEDRWEFSHRSILEFFYACYVTERVNKTVDWGAVLQSGNVHRLVAWNASDFSEVFTGALERTFSIVTATRLAEVLSQNLLLEHAALHGYALYIENVLGRVLSCAEISLYDKEARRCIRIEIPVSRGDGASAGDVVRLLYAIHNARDGSANAVLARRIASSVLPGVKVIAPLLLPEFKASISCDGDGIKSFVVISLDET